MTDYSEGRKKQKRTEKRLVRKQRTSRSLINKKRWLIIYKTNRKRELARLSKRNMKTSKNNSTRPNQLVKLKIISASNNVTLLLKAYTIKLSHVKSTLRIKRKVV